MGVYEVSCGGGKSRSENGAAPTRLYHGNLKKHASDAQKPMLDAYATARAPTGNWTSILGRARDPRVP